MGYCPRCGENSPFTSDERQEQISPDLGTIRIDTRTNVVPLPETIAEGDMIQYGGVRFRVRREGAYLLLDNAG